MTETPCQHESFTTRRTDTGMVVMTCEDCGEVTVALDFGALP